MATKYSNALPGTDPNAAGNQRKNMVQAVEASLKRLQTDYIDLYWVHIWDQLTPVEEVRWQPALLGDPRIRTCAQVIERNPGEGKSDAANELTDSGN